MPSKDEKKPVTAFVQITKETKQGKKYSHSFKVQTWHKSSILGSLHKGDHVLIEGEPTINKWNDKEEFVIDISTCIHVMIPENETEDDTHADELFPMRINNPNANGDGDNIHEEGFSDDIPF